MRVSLTLKFLSFLVFFIGEICVVSAQKLLASQDFGIATPFLEPDDRSLMVKISTSDFVCLAKQKGNQTGTYLLSRYDTSLQKKWEVVFEEGEQEDILQLQYLKGKLILFTNIHDTKKRYAALRAYTFDLNQGQRGKAYLLDSVAVNNFVDSPTKAQVKESFLDAVASSVRKNYLIPFEYRFKLTFSPDSNLFLVTWYDLSKDELVFTGSIYEANFTLKSAFEKSIGDNLIHHGIYLNNKAEVFILNTEGSGKIGLTRFVKGDRTKSTYLDVMATNLNRHSFKLKMIKDEVIYVVNLNDQNNICAGFTFYRFNFENNSVENWVDHDFTENLKNKVHNERLMKKAGEEKYTYLAIDNFYVDAKEDIFITIEKRELKGAGYRYDPLRTFHPKNQTEASLNIITEGLFILHVDKEGNRKSEEYYYKSQKDLVNGGLNTISFFEDYDLHTIRILYAGSEGFSETMNKIYLAKFDIIKGELIKTYELENPEGLTLLRKYSLLIGEHALITVGKKGVLGKSSKLVKYQL